MSEEKLLPCREAFEEWYGSNPEFGKYCYTDQIVQARWEAWQAAWNTRAQPQNVEGDLDDWIKAPAAKDYDDLLVQFRAMKCLLNSQGERLSWYSNIDYSLSEKRLNELNASLESEREMNAELTEEVEKLSHPHQSQSGDVQEALDYITGAGHGDFPPEIEDTIKRVLKSALTAQHTDVNQELLDALRLVKLDTMKRDEEMFIAGTGNLDHLLETIGLSIPTREAVQQAIARAEKEGA